MSNAECLIHNAKIFAEDVPDNFGIRCVVSNEGDSIDVETHVVMPDGTWRWHDEWFGYVDGDLSRKDFRRAMKYMDGVVDGINLAVSSLAGNEGKVA